MTYKGSQINKQTLDPTLQQEITNTTAKANNSWQLSKFNDTDITNISNINASRVFYITGWKAPVTNLEQVSIVIPTANFNGTVKVTVTGGYNNSDAFGTFEYVTHYAKIGDTLYSHQRTILKADKRTATEYYFPDFNFSGGLFTIPIIRKPNAMNNLSVKVELLTTQDGTFEMLKDATIVYEDLGTTWHSYPWTPQSTSFLAANTYNPNNIMTNIGANRATRVFPQINWQAQGMELWETTFMLTNSVWGILELDIAGYSSAAGGAKIAVELGIHVPNSSQPSDEYKNVMKVITASSGFTENFYVEFEHRHESRIVLIKVYKRVHNDPVVVTATFTSTVSPMSAFEFLGGFHTGILYTNIAGVPTTRQIDFDKRITENFTLFSSFKQKIASATTDKGVPTSADATSDQMAANIRSIPTSQYWSNNVNVAPGATSFQLAGGGSSVYMNTCAVTIPFKPKMLYAQSINGYDTYTTTCTELADAFGSYNYKVASYSGAQGQMIISHLKANYTQSGKNYTFIIPVPVGNRTYTIIAT